MLKQEPSTGVQPVPRSTAGLWAFFRGELVPLDQARISVTTHAFNYGTAVFEGIRAYWNAEQEQLYGLDLLAHYQRLHRSAPILQLDLRHSAEELVDITCEMLRRSEMREDAYIRPILYKSTEAVGVRLHNLETDLVIFTLPFGKYIDTEGGIRAQVSSWRRNDDNAIPARSKITGGYVNGALAKSEAQMNGYDEAIMLTQDGHVSEGSAENLFIVRDGVTHHPGDHRQRPGGDHPPPHHGSGRRPGHRGRRAGHGPHRAVPGGRGLPVRDRRPARARDRDRQPTDRRRDAGSDHATAPHDLLRRRSRPVRDLPRLADAGLLVARHGRAHGGLM